MDAIRHTRDPNSTRVLDPLDRKIRSLLERGRENRDRDEKQFRSFAGTLRRRGKVLRCRSVLRCSRKMGQGGREGGRCWLGFNLCAATTEGVISRSWLGWA